MDVQRRLTEFLTKFCAENAICQVPTVEIGRNRGKNRNIESDCRVYVRPTQLFREYVDRFVEQLLLTSMSWPIPVAKCTFDTSTSYIEVWLPRKLAFESLMRRVLHAREATNGNICGKTALVYVPYMDLSFTSVRTELLASYVAVCCSNEGLVTSVYSPDWEVISVPSAVTHIQYSNETGHTTNDKVCELLQQCEHYDHLTGKLDLREYLQAKGDEKQSEYDFNIGLVSRDSIAFKTAVLLLDIVQNHFGMYLDVIVVVVPHQKSFVVQTAGLVFEVLFSLLTKTATCPRLRYLLHNRVSALECSSLDTYLSLTRSYLREAFVQRGQMRSIEDLERSVEILIRSKLTFDVLSSKQNVKVVLKRSDNYEGKGGLFVQYSSARMSALLAKHDDGVKNGMYPALSPLEDTDFSALDSDLQWRLWHSMDACMNFLESMETCQGSVKLDVDAHRLCEELVAMCLAFGAFYSKVKVLVEPQQHLLGTMNARLWLVKAVHMILCRMLQVLNLKPLERM